MHLLHTNWVSQVSNGRWKTLHLNSYTKIFMLIYIKKYSNPTKNEKKKLQRLNVSSKRSYKGQKLAVIFLEDQNIFTVFIEKCIKKIKVLKKFMILVHYGLLQILYDTVMSF